MPTTPILVLNSGSSSIKFSMWDSADDCPHKMLEGEIEGIGVAGAATGHLWIKSWLDGADGSKLIDEKSTVSDIGQAFSLIAEALGKPPFQHPSAIGHRMVCGGPTVTENQRITPELLEEMGRYISFAPLHAPSALFIMRHAMQLFPDTPNFICLDSWFHRDIPLVTRNLPIPAAYTSLGLRRFGAHGLSYESIVANLEPNVPSRLIVAHLGNGSSVTAIRDGRSVDTSMGLTPTGGLISGSRTGDLDPGILVFMLREIGKKESTTSKAADALEAVVNKQSGLRGVSDLSNDMRTLRQAISAGNPAARLSVDEFVYVLRKYIGAYSAILGGLDMLVFTGGIGENDTATRAEVCAGLGYLGLVFEETRNQSAKGKTIISSDVSSVIVQVIPAAEDLTIVNHVRRLMA